MDSSPSVRSTRPQGAVPPARLCSGVLEGSALAMLGILAHLLNVLAEGCCTASCATTAATASMLQGLWVLPAVLAIDPVLFVLLSWEHYRRFRGIVSMFQRFLLSLGIGLAIQPSSNWFSRLLWNYRLLFSHLGCALAHIPESWHWAGALLSWIAATLSAEALNTDQPAGYGLERGHIQHVSGALAATTNSTAGSPVLQAHWCFAALTSRSSLMYLAQVLIPGLLLWVFGQWLHQSAPCCYSSTAANVAGSVPIAEGDATAFAATARAEAAQAGRHCRSTERGNPTSEASAMNLSSYKPGVATSNTASAINAGTAAIAGSRLKRNRSARKLAKLASSKLPSHSASPVQAVQATNSTPSSVVAQATGVALFACTPVPGNMAALAVPYAPPAASNAALSTSATTASSYSQAPPPVAQQAAAVGGLNAAAAHAAAAFTRMHEGTLRSSAVGPTAWHPRIAGVGMAATSAAAGQLAAGLFLHPVAAVLPPTTTPAAAGGGTAPAELCVDSRYVEQLQQLCARYACGAGSCLRVVIARQPQGTVLLDRPWNLSQQSLVTTAEVEVTRIPSMTATAPFSAAAAVQATTAVVAPVVKPLMPVIEAAEAKPKTAAAAAALSAHKVVAAHSQSRVASPPPLPPPPSAAAAEGAAAACQVLSVLVLLDNSSVMNIRGRANVPVSASTTTTPAAGDFAVASSNAAAQLPRGGATITDADAGSGAATAGAAPPACTGSPSVASTTTAVASSSAVLAQLPLLVLPVLAQQELQQLFDAMVRSGMHSGDAYQQLLPLLHDWALLLLMDKQLRRLLSVFAASSTVVRGGSGASGNASSAVHKLILKQQAVFDAAFALVSSFLLRYQLLKCQTLLLQLQQTRQVYKRHALQLLQLSGVTVAGPPSARAAAAAVEPAADSSASMSTLLQVTSSKQSGDLELADQGNTRHGRKLVHVRRNSFTAAVGAVAALTGISSGNTNTASSNGINRNSKKLVFVESRNNNSRLFTSAGFSPAASRDTSGDGDVQQPPHSSTDTADTKAHTSDTRATCTDRFAALCVSASASSCCISWRSIAFGFADVAAAESYAKYKAAVLQHHDYLTMSMWCAEALLCVVCKLLKFAQQQWQSQSVVVLLLTMSLKVTFVGIAAAFHGVMWLAAACQHEVEQHQIQAQHCHPHHQQQQEQEQRRLASWKLRVLKMVQFRDAALVAASTAITLISAGCYLFGGVWSSALAQMMQGLHSSLLLYSFFNCVVQPLLFRAGPAAVLTYCITLIVQSALFPPWYAAVSGMVSGVIPCAVVACLLAVSMSITCWLELKLQQSFVARTKHPHEG